MSEGREEALKLVNITKAYQMGEQTIEVLKNVNLTVKRG
ncbi:MAG TPA: macrolide ABC transporter ATP-binding protein, partial [Thermofilum sp.]|nr:macrolide ABC transporter ATP-binding protein [Thermofilum sp.]